MNKLKVEAGGICGWLSLLLVLAGNASAVEQQAVGSAAGQSPRAPASPRLADDLAPSPSAGEYRWLEPLVGSWNLELRRRGADGAETRLGGASENRWTLDGRFLLCELSAGEGPSRIQAISIYGFDSRQKRHFALHLHNLATSAWQLSGSYDGAARSFLLSGKEYDESTGSVVVLREVLRIDGPDRHELSVYLDVPGRMPVKIVEAVFTRR